MSTRVMKPFNKKTGYAWMTKKPYRQKLKAPNKLIIRSFTIPRIVREIAITAEAR